MAEDGSEVGLGRIPQSITNRPFVEDDKASQTLGDLVNKGKFVNAKTDDDDVHMTIMGYYIPKLS